MFMSFQARGYGSEVIHQANIDGDGLKEYDYVLLLIGRRIERIAKLSLQCIANEASTTDTNVEANRQVLVSIKTFDSIFWIC